MNSALQVHLIQRGTFRSVLSQNGGNLDALIRLDYMGSSEFEFGTLSRSLKAVRSLGEDAYTSFKVPNLPRDKDLYPRKHIHARDGRSLLVLCPKTLQDLVIPVIHKMLLDEHSLHLQEPTYLSMSLFDPEALYHHDFWWDVENHWFMFLGEKLVPKVLQALFSNT